MGGVRIAAGPPPPPEAGASGGGGWRERERAASMDKRKVCAVLCCAVLCCAVVCLRHVEFWTSREWFRATWVSSSQGGGGSLASLFGVRSLEFGFLPSLLWVPACLPHCKYSSTSFALVDVPRGVDPDPSPPRLASLIPVVPPLLSPASTSRVMVMVCSGNARLPPPPLPSPLLRCSASPPKN